MSDRLSPQREAEIREWVHAMGQRKDIRYYGSWQQHGELLAELDAVRAERDQARMAALHEAADHFDRMADSEPDQSYRARIMRSAANDIRRLATTPTPTAEEAS